MVSNLILGTACLDNYVSQPKELNEAGKNKINSLIAQLESSALNVEQLPLKLLKIQRAQYPIINPSFLSMHNTIDYEGLKIQVPKFSVYSKSEEGFDEFNIRISTSDDSFFGVFPEYKMDMYINNDNLSSLLKKPLLNSTGFDSEKSSDYYYWKRIAITKDTGKRWKKVCGGEGIQLTSTFYGILPQETKEKLKESESIFNKNLYLVAETKPEAWNVKKIVKDPLLIGIFENKCYLIDHFNTTSVEYYVRKEFTE